MGWNRSATILSVIVLAAFGFMVIGVFSDPLSRHILSIAEKDGYHYGILGYCNTSGQGSTCTGYGLGYSLQGSNWPSHAETLTKAFIVHIVAAGLLLISLILALFCHFRSIGLWIFVAVILGISTIAAALAFALEIYIFKMKLKFAGWFSLPAALLALFGMIGVIVMRYQLAEQLREPSLKGKDFFLGDPANFRAPNDLNFTANDGLMEKDKSVVTSSYSLSQPSLTDDREKDEHYSRFTNLTTQRGYQRIPEKMGSSTTLGSQKTAHPLPLPIKSDRENIGAIPRSDKLPSQMSDSPRKVPNFAQPAANQGLPSNISPISEGQRAAEYARNLSRGMPNQPLSSTGTPGSLNNVGNVSGTVANAANSSVNAVASGVRNTGQSAAGAGVAIAGAAPTAAAALGSTVAGATKPGRSFGDAMGFNNNDQSSVPRSQRKETWSQMALKKAQDTSHKHNFSVASSQPASHIPAGHYVRGVERSESFGPNVVQIPKLRKQTVPAPESAVIEYYKDETETRSPLAQAKVPNYSRMSIQDQTHASPSKPRSKPLPTQPEDRELNSVKSTAMNTATNGSSRERAQSMSRAGENGTANPAHAEYEQPGNSQAYSGQSQSQYDYSQYTQPTHDRMQYDQTQYGQDQYGSTQYQYGASQYAQAHTMQSYDQGYYGDQHAQYTQPPETYAAYGQPSYAGNYPGYEYQSAYASGYAPQHSAYGSPNHHPRPAANRAHHYPRPPKPVQTSEVVINSNPDFAIGGLDKKRRPGGRM